MTDGKPFPKIQVKEVFKAKGADDAVTLGRSLGITEGRLQRWMSEWSNGEIKQIARRKSLYVNPNAKKVYDKYVPARTGTVIVEGEQVSEVRWDDDEGGLWPITSFVSNEHLVEVKK